MDWVYESYIPIATYLPIKKASIYETYLSVTYYGLRWTMINDRKQQFQTYFHGWT